MKVQTIDIKKNENEFRRGQGVEGGGKQKGRGKFRKKNRSGTRPHPLARHPLVSIGTAL